MVIQRYMYMYNVFTIPKFGQSQVSDLISQDIRTVKMSSDLLIANMGIVNKSKRFYMASSLSGQDESNPTLWLATRAGKMKLHVNVSCLLRITCCILQEKFMWKPYNKSSIDQAGSVKMAWYWPSSLFVNAQKKNLANIQIVSADYN